MSTRTRFGIGDVAVVELPAGPAEVRVVEDRGPLGVGGRRLVRVEVLDGAPETPMTFELPEELLLEATPERRREIRRRREAERHTKAAQDG
jgi:hypothetical protein